MAEDMARPEISVPGKKIDRRPSGGSNTARNLALALALITAAAGTGVVLTQRGSGPSPETPPPSAAASLPPKPETASPTVAPTEKPTPTPTEAPKALPEIINKETVKFVVKSPDEVQKMIDEAKARGEVKIALPDILNRSGVSIREIQNATGLKGFAITAEAEGNYSIMAEAPGDIAQIVIDLPDRIANNNVIITSQGWAYVVPDSASSQFKKGDSFKMGDTILSFKYEPQSPAGQRFIKYLGGTFPGAPQNTIAVFGNERINLNKGNVLRAPTGEVVLISSQK